MPDHKRAFAKQLRQTMTDTERLLWRYLRRSHFGVKFRRQQPIGQYIVDFVCFENKLVVEVDGGQHLESASDERRDAWLRGQGFEILRFWNNQVLEQTEAVLEKIYGVLSPSPHPLPHQGGGAHSTCG
jgi:very-short-patch-repair endonuclease